MVTDQQVTLLMLRPVRWWIGRLGLLSAAPSLVHTHHFQCLLPSQSGQIPVGVENNKLFRPPALDVPGA